MKLLSKYSDSTLRLIYVLITAYCFILIGIPFFRATISDRLAIDGCNKNVLESLESQSLIIISIIPDEPADKAGLKPGDKIISVNGKPVKNITEFNNIIMGIQENIPVIYTIERDNIIFNVDVHLYKYFHLIFFIFFALGLVFLINGFLVGYSRPKEFTSQIFFLLGCTASLGFINYGGVWYYTGLNTIFYYNYLIGDCLFFPVFFHFFTIYPEKYKFKNRRLSIFLVYVFILFINFFFEFIPFVPKNLFSEILFQVLFYSPLLLPGIGIFLFINSYRKFPDNSYKKSLRIILYGFFIGGLGFVYYFLIFNHILVSRGINYNPLIRIPIILTLAAPLSFAYSIFKYKILDTEIIVKKILVFGILTFFITIVYLIVLYIFDIILAQYTGNKTFLTVSSVVIIIFTFDYVNKWANSFVDKRFYRKRYNYRISLLKFSEELPFINNLKDVIEKVNFSIRETMGISIVKFWIIDKEFVNIIQSYFKIKDKGQNDIYRIRDKIFSIIFENNPEHKFLYNVDLNELNIPDEYKDFIKKEEIVLTIPITIKDKLIGAINFGKKPFDTPFSDEDIDLLKTIASQTAIIFENSRLKINETKKQKIEEELKIAKNIQKALIPRLDISFSGMDISGLTEPAKEVGGDFFDFVKLDDTKILVTIADVSGKGVPAALYMTKLQALIRFASKLFKTPKSILSEVNKQIFKKLEKNFFVTTNLALFDIESKKVYLARAGHNPVLFFSNKSCKQLKSKGIGLGLDNESIFNENLEEIEIEYKTDDIFVFYTDGLNEAMNANKEEFGINRIIEIVNKNSELDSKNIQNELMKEISMHRANAEQNDDISLVIIKIK
ncbi:MAG: SpoIIE family protein phosphatase [Ignavibacteria bacterium]